jgi:hypothetical protein
VQEQDRDSISAAPADCLLRLFVRLSCSLFAIFWSNFTHSHSQYTLSVPETRFGGKIPNLADQFREMWGFLRDFRGPPFAQ